MMERAILALNYRREGLTLKQVGEKLTPSVGRERARMLVNKGMRIEKNIHLDFFRDSIPKMVKYALKAEGITTEEQARAAIESGEIKQSNLCNVGKKGWKDLIQYLYREKD